MDNKAISEGPPLNDYTANIAACPYYFISEGKLEMPL